MIQEVCPWCSGPFDAKRHGRTGPSPPNAVGARAIKRDGNRLREADGITFVEVLRAGKWPILSHPDWGCCAAGAPTIDCGGTATGCALRTHPFATGTSRSRNESVSPAGREMPRSEKASLDSGGFIGGTEGSNPARSTGESANEPGARAYVARSSAWRARCLLRESRRAGRGSTAPGYRRRRSEPARCRCRPSWYFPPDGRLGQRRIGQLPRLRFDLDTGKRCARIINCRLDGALQ